MSHNPWSLEMVDRAAADPAEWDTLIDASGQPSPFLRSWWLEAVTAAPRPGERPLYLQVRRNSTLVGGAALVLDRRLLGIPRYRFAGQGVLTPDHLDLVALAGHERAVADAFAAWFGGPGWRLLDLDGIDAGGLVQQAVRGWQRDVDAAPYALLPGTADGYLGGLSSSFRRSLRRARRGLADASYAHQRIAPEAAPAALAAFWGLHRARGDRDRLLAEAPVLDRAVLAGVARGECRLDVLTDGRETIAVAIAFETAGRLSLYQVARSVAPEHGSAGTVLLADVIADAAEGGCREVDLLRGEEGYKAHFADRRRAMVALRAGHGNPARALVGLRRLLSAARAMRRAAADRRTSP